MVKGNFLNRKAGMKEGILEHQERRRNIISKNMSKSNRPFFF
jgi:hypothetical protein